MKNISDARKLAHTMVDIGKSVGKKTVALITPMDRPLGNYIGNSLEVIEAIEILKGNASGNLKTVALELGARMLVLGGIADNTDNALKMLNRNIENGKGLAKLKELIIAQGGNPLVCNNYSLLPQAKASYTLTASQNGIVTGINTADIGRASVATGAGRTIKDAPIDLSAGIIMHKTIGDNVNVGDTIAEVFADDEKKCKLSADIIKMAVNIGDSTAEAMPPIIDIIE
jgi:pyrimidine-nucleoside phosphorylase